MKVYFRDQCAWFEDGYEPTPDERKVLAAVTAALPDTLQAIQINEVCEYVRVAEGCDLRGPWAEYHFNVQGESELPMEGACQP